MAEDFHSKEYFEKEQEHLGKDATAKQHSAADPAQSVWVEASAGTGKTKVLTDRVLRLLLNGVDPIRLLCLTYTKAAAVEMLSRISQRLSKWAVEDESKLDENLRDLLGDVIKTPADLQKYRKSARKLFAKLLDTPGGIKVQTLHSFCTDVLKRFPLEAGISPYFTVLEDEAVINVLAQIKAEIVQADETTDSPALAEARRYLMENASETTFGDMVKTIIGSRRKMVEIIHKHGGLGAFLQALGAKLGIRNTDTDEILKQEFMDSLKSRLDLMRADIDAWSHGNSKYDTHKAEVTEQIIADNFSATHYEAYRSCFLKVGNELKIGKKEYIASDKARDYDDKVEARFFETGKLLQDFEQKRLRLNVYQSTKAAFTVAEEINRRYEEYKRTVSSMDFDDLIMHTKNLLGDSAARQWVLYKLDGGIEHILVDEAQDTSPDQWDIIAKLCDEFFCGEGQSEKNRTLFVVGDRKQSIYGFQGADPKKLDEMYDKFRDAAKSAGKVFEPVDLDISFRSAPAILDSVNRIFAGEQAADGVVSKGHKVDHIPYRVGQFAKVTIMPLMEPEKGEKVNTDDEYMHSPMEREYKPALVTKMAEETAYRIRRLIDDSVADKKPIHYRDIMVLVRTRSHFVQEFIRACEKEHIAISGADRMVLSEQIAIQDLISLGKFLLFPADDLALAEVLTSPLFSVGWELLEDLCYGRERKETLWSRMLADSRCAEMCNQLTTLLNNLDYVRPYELFNFVLSQLGGRSKFIARMGQEVEDALDEFMNLTLDFEQHQIPSLQGFISWFENSKHEIKRESDDQETDAVRLLTIHHSKGLQAPIVFLPDTISLPLRGRGNAFLSDDKLGYYPLKAGHYDDICNNLHQQKVQDLMQEYHRLLYVALTRAEDRLYIGAYGNRNADSWYELCQKAFVDAVVQPNGDIEETTTEFVQKKQKKPTPPTMFKFEPAEWVDDTLEPESALAKPYTPSKEETDEEPDSVSPLADNEKFYRRGTLIHRLLQFLPQSVGNRDKAVDVFLQKYAADFPDFERRQIKTEVLRLVDSPEFAEIFGLSSRAEVPIMGEVGGKIISAQLDRLVVLPDKIMIVDFKTNRPACHSVEQTPPVYINQLKTYAELASRIYPHRQIEAYILWTNAMRLMRVL